MRYALLVSGAMLCLAGRTALSQNKPNFSGTWRWADRQDSLIAFEFTIKHVDHQSIQITRSSPLPQVDYTYTLVGIDSDKGAITLGRDTLLKNGTRLRDSTVAKWSKETLELTTTLHVGQEPGHSSQVVRRFTVSYLGVLVPELTYESVDKKVMRGRK